MSIEFRLTKFPSRQGVPAAFSPSCSESHIPGYINHARLKDAGNVFVVSVNDPFVYVHWPSFLPLKSTWNQPISQS